MKILLVDDDPDLLAVTGYALQQAGFLVVKAEDGVAALAAFQREQPDLAVLDINLPRMNGFELAQKLRERSRIPLIMLTARSEEEDVVRALSLGADDYLSKPFSPKILLARVKALLRRVGIEAEETVALGALSLDVAELTLNGLPRGPVRLTPLESRFLQLLFANAGRTVSTDRLLVHVWGNRAGGNRQLLKQLVHRLRQKLEDDPADPKLVRTMPNAGYLIDPGASPEAAPVVPRPPIDDDDRTG
jgi:DNA-binding response OmpR family regulator